MKKIVFYNVIIFVFFYSLLEVFTGYIFFKNKLDCSYLLCNRTYNFVTPFDFYGKNNKTIYSRDKYGFRGRYKDLDKIDILVVGGSTTDERFLKLEDTWTENLEKIFLNKNKKIDVVNAGLDGQSTYGHIWNFENWFNKLKNFKPKYVIFYIGINERLDLMHYDNYLPKNYSLFKKVKYFIKKNNGITYKIAHFIYKKFYLNDTYIVSKGVSHIERKPNYQLVSEDYNLSNDYKIYLSRNLHELNEHVKKIKSIPIFITQKTLMGKFENNQYYSVNDTNMFLHEKKISLEIINFCKKNNLICYDLNNEINFDNDDMYDLIHTTPEGSLKISNFIYSKIKDEIYLN